MDDKCSTAGQCNCKCGDCSYARGGMASHCWVHRSRGGCHKGCRLNG